MFICYHGFIETGLTFANGVDDSAIKIKKKSELNCISCVCVHIFLKLTVALQFAGGGQSRPYSSTVTS